MILVYTYKKTPRVIYVFKQIFQQVLGVSVELTTEINEFIEHKGPKMSYAPRALGKELHFRNSSLLFESGINEWELKVDEFEGLVTFFSVPEPSALPFDPFAASFYLLTRYEEYLPHIKDKHERFSAESSVAHKGGFLQRPVVDEWALAIKDLLAEGFPEFQWPVRKFQFVNTIDIDNAYAYRGKGLMRSLGGFIRALTQFDGRGIWARLNVLAGLRSDPYDTFAYLKRIQREYGLETIYFFLLADYGLNDKNVPYTNNRFRNLIKDIADYAQVGIHPSYGSNRKKAKLASEVQRLEGIIHRDVTKSRQHFLKLTVPETYRNLIDLDITDDYTMGYASEIGFRSGTCSTYYFYDLDLEFMTPLRLHPFAVMEGTLKFYQGLGPEQALKEVLPLMDRVAAVGGTFISLWHNESACEGPLWKGWRLYYEEMIKAAHAKMERP